MKFLAINPNTIDRMSRDIESQARDPELTGDTDVLRAFRAVSMTQAGS